MGSTPTLSIIGPGVVGKTLSRLFQTAGLCQIHQVIASSLDSSINAATKIGAGIPAELCQLSPCNLLMVTVPDDQMNDVLESLKGKISPNTIVFHCSGVLPSLKTDHYLSASVHPLKSFADVAMAVNSFHGTPCAIEGHPQATCILSALFSAIGGNVISIKTEDKALWHLAAVFSSNYLNGLMHLSQTLYARMGIPQSQIKEVLAPITTKTLEQILSLGSTKALTGPMERGDVKTIETHLKALEALPKEYLEVYRSLGSFILPLSKSKGKAKQVDLEQIQSLLEGKLPVSMSSTT